MDTRVPVDEEEDGEDDEGTDGSWTITTHGEANRVCQTQEGRTDDGGHEQQAVFIDGRCKVN